jgi:hypothetical protein
VDKAAEIQKKKGYTQSVGGQLYVANGQLAYWPGLEVQADINNWAEDFYYAIKYGSNHTEFDPRLKWLKAFRRVVKDECDLSEHNHDNLRVMLKELMEDGSFCPDQKILDSKGKKKLYKQVLQEAVEANRFPQYCKSLGVKNDSSREIKDIQEKNSRKSQKNISTPQ